MAYEAHAPLKATTTVIEYKTISSVRKTSTSASLWFESPDEQSADLVRNCKFKHTDTMNEFYGRTSNKHGSLQQALDKALKNST